MSTDSTRHHATAGLLAAVLLALAGTASAGWLAGYDCRQQITVAPSITPANLASFPLLVQITNPANDVFAKAAYPAGQDIVFTSADGTTVLPREIERYSAGATKGLDAWVRTDLSSSAPTTLYMYYGGPALGNATATWDPTYKLVQHLQEDPSGAAPQMKDSTANANHGRTYGTMTDTDQVPGKANGSLDFDGVDDFVRCGSSSSLNTPGDYTIEMWAYSDNDGTTATKPYPTLLNRARQSGTNGFFWIYTRRDTPGRLDFQYANGSTYKMEAFPGALPKDEWKHLVFTYADAAKQLKLYVDGTQYSTTRTFTNPQPVDDGTLHLGTYNGSTSNYPYDGQLDEVRLATVARSAQWVEATYNNQSNPAAHQTAGPAEQQASGWLEGWRYRQAVTLSSNAVPTDASDQDILLANIPVPIKLGDPANGVFAHSPAGSDIVFTTDDGLTLMPSEIEHYSNTAGSESLCAWVSVPALASSDDTVLYMYYGGPDTADSTDTWDPHYKMVQHLQGNPTAGAPQMLDSTAYGNDGTCSGMSAANQAIGPLDGAVSFDGVNDFVNCGSKTSLNTPDDYTIEMWVYNDAGAKKYPTLFNRGPQNGSDGYFWSYILTGDPTTLWFQFATGSGTVARSFAGALPENEWSHIAFTFEDATKELTLFRNGVQLGSTTLTGSLPVDDDTFYLGTYYGGTSNYPFDGILDEARLSDIARSPEWLLASYRFMAEDHLSFGVEQTPEPTTLTLLGLGALALVRRRRRAPTHPHR